MSRRLRLGYVQSEGDGAGRITIHEPPLDEQVYTEFLEVVAVVPALQPLAIAYRGVSAARAQLSRLQAELEEAFSRAPFHGAEVYQAGLDNLAACTGAVSWFLSAGSAFLSQTKRGLVDRFGAESQQVQVWDQARKAAFQEHFAYRFLYHLRNYSQHYGLPVSNLSAEGNRQDGRMVIDSSLTLDRDALLSNSYEWPVKLRSEIAAQANEVELRPLIAEFSRDLSTLALLVFHFDDESLGRCGRYLSIVEERVAAPPGAQIYIFVGDVVVGDGHEVNAEVVPTVAYGWLTAIRDEIERFVAPE